MPKRRKPATSARPVSSLAWVGLVTLATTVVLLSSCSSPWLIKHTVASTPGCLVDVKNDHNLVALTIDDGPDAVNTPAILDVLAQHRAHATFFLITEKIPGNEAVVRRLLREGHEIGNHLTRDESSIGLSPKEFESSLVEADRILSQFTSPGWVRPGGGRHDQKMVEIWQAHGYRCALGSVYPFDAQIPWAWYASWLVRSKTRTGSIVILHDGAKRGARTSTALASILPALDSKDLRVVTLSELVAHEGG